MKMAIKTLSIGIAACALAGPAFAYTINGTIPADKGSVVIDLQKPFASRYLKLTFSSPPVNAGVPYIVGICIGPAANPCEPLPLALFPGHQAIAPVDTAIFQTYINSVGKGTGVATPYTLEVDPLP